jgi:LysR family transcriptional activator of dmlA
VVQEEFDIVIRYGKLADSELRARLFGYLSYCLCASPEYVAAHGWPTKISELTEHHCLTDTSGTFQFNDDQRIKLKGRWASNSGTALRWAARRGLGIAHLPVSIARQDLVDGHLVAMDATWSFHDQEVWAVFSHNIMPASMRLFIDYLIARFTKEKIRPWMAGRISPSGPHPSSDRSRS